MKRRESLKFIAASALATGAIAVGCKPVEKKVVDKVVPHKEKYPVHRYEEEEKHEDEVARQPKFFSNHEFETLVVLADIIIPRDEGSGSASDAKVAEFIEFTVKDQPHYQTPMRGGLRWLDMQCLNKFQKAFKDCSNEEQIKMVDLIAYPERAKGKAELSQGVSFFSKMRDLTCTGFYTTEMGIKDLGYAGNKPNKWNGVPDDVLKQYGLAYTEKELKECISFNV